MLANLTRCLVAEGTLASQRWPRSQGPTEARVTQLRWMGAASGSTTAEVVATGDVGEARREQSAHGGGGTLGAAGGVADRRVHTADDSRLANRYIAIRTFTGLRAGTPGLPHNSATGHSSFAGTSNFLPEKYRAWIANILKKLDASNLKCLNKILNCYSVSHVRLMIKKTGP